MSATIQSDTITISLKEYRELTGICKRLLNGKHTKDLFEILVCRAHRAKEAHRVR